MTRVVWCFEQGNGPGSNRTEHRSYERGKEDNAGLDVTSLPREDEFAHIVRLAPLVSWFRPISCGQKEQQSKGVLSLSSPDSLRKWWAIEDRLFLIHREVTACRGSLAIHRRSPRWAGVQKQLFRKDCVKCTRSFSSKMASKLLKETPKSEQCTVRYPPEISWETDESRDGS